MVRQPVEKTKASIKRTKMVDRKNTGGKQGTTRTAKTKKKRPGGNAVRKQGGKNAIDKKAMNKLILKGQKQGYLSYDEINKALPEDMLSTEQIDDTLILFDKLNIKIVDEKKQSILKIKKKASEEAGKGGSAQEVFRESVGIHSYWGGVCSPP